MSLESSSDLRRLFGDALYEHAQQLVDDGRVVEARVLQSGRILAGIVSTGDGAHQHRVYIRRPAAVVRSGSDVREPVDVSIDGECNCGVRLPCVHIAAVSIAARNNKRVPAQQLTRSLPGTAPMAHSSQQRLCYVFVASAREPMTELQLTLWVSHIGPGGRYTHDGACAFAPRAAQATGDFPRYVDAQDRQILRTLLAESAEGPWSIRAAEGAALMRCVLGADRGYLGSLEGPVLRASGPRTVAFEWKMLSGGEQQLHPTGSKAMHLLLDLDPPQYIDTLTGECGPLEVGASLALLRELARCGAIVPEQVDFVNAQLASAAAQIPTLRALRVERQACRSVVPKLVLSAEAEPALYMLYNGLSIEESRLRSAGTHVRQVGNEVIHEIERDPAAEQRFRTQLTRVLPAVSHRDGWLAFQLQAVPQLRAEDWYVEVDDRYPYRLAAADDWYADVRQDAREPWFNVQLGVTVDGREVNLLPAFVGYLQASMPSDGASRQPEPAIEGCCRIGEHWLVRLEDGRYLPIPIERMQRIAHTLVELFDRDSLDKLGRLTLPGVHIARLMQLGREVPQLRCESSLSTLLERLEAASAIAPVPAPAGLRATLRSYQEEGLGWLQFLRSHDFGGILADDMGLGKTVQTLAHLLLEKTQGRLRKPALIVAPVSAIGNWQAEIARFAPELKRLTLHGARRREAFHSIAAADVIVTGYPSMQLDLELLQQHEFSLLILDEAQTIKNPRARVSQAVRAVRAEQRLCLTGTPMENHLGELWSLCDFLQPGLMGDERQFQRHYRTPIEKHRDTGRAQALAARIAPFLLRRTKAAVVAELPPKTEIVEPIVLEDRQRDLYDGVRLAMHRHIRELVATRGLGRSQITILDALLKLRQVCCDPRLVSEDAVREQIPSAKLDWLAAALPELIAEGRRILLFSQFTSMLRLIESLLEGLAIPYCLLTGETRERDTVVKRFQSGAAPVFLISLKAGGTALNLTAADTVIHYDPWWNPAVEAQATDRAHRIGQDQPVFVYKLIAQGTVEERMLQLQADKRALAGQLYEAGGASSLSLSSAELEMLFAP